MDSIYGTFFKYRPIGAVGSESRERLARTFTHGEIYFAAPSTLNDPFDCRPRFEFSGKPKEQRRVLRDMWVAGAIRNGVPTKKARQLSESAATELMVKVKTPETRAEQFFEFIDQKTGAYCMSTSCEVATQWAYYADDYQGLCLEFTIDKKHGFAPVYPVKYSEDRPCVDVFRLLNDTEPTETLLRAVTTKSDNWEREKEVRALQNRPGVYRLPDRMLTGVVFGTNTGDEEVEWIQEQIKSADHSVSYSRIIPNLDHYVLNRIDLT